MQSWLNLDDSSPRIRPPPSADRALQIVDEMRRRRAVPPPSTSWRVLAMTGYGYGNSGDPGFWRARR